MIISKLFVQFCVELHDIAIISYLCLTIGAILFMICLYSSNKRANFINL